MQSANPHAIGARERPVGGTHEEGAVPNSTRWRDREGLIDAALSAQVALVTREEKPEPKDIEWLGRLRDLLLYRVGELRAAEEARTLVEERYLDGHTALFPDLAAAWGEQVECAEVIADMAVRLAEIDSGPVGVPADYEAAVERTAQLVADLVRPAKSDALEKLGEGERAFGIATEWLRSKWQRTTDE